MVCKSNIRVGLKENLYIAVKRTWHNFQINTFSQKDMCILHAKLASVLKFKGHHAQVNRSVGVIVL